MGNDKNTVSGAIKIGGVLFLIVGIILAGRMLLFPGPSSSYAAGEGALAAKAVVNGDVQEVAIDLGAGSYTPILVQKGIPVRFNIRASAENINGCNGTVVIPEYDVKATLKPGDNILTFTPDKAGTIPYSCWMGMITSDIKVVDDLSAEDAAAVPVPAGSGFRMPCCSQQPEVAPQ